MTQRISAAKVAFDSTIDSSEAWMGWIEGAQKVESILGKNIRWESLSTEDRKTFNERLSKQPPPSQILLNSFYMAMAAGFEQYLRKSIGEVVTEINTKKIKPADMDKDLIKLHMRETAKLLRRLDSPPDHIIFNEEELCRKIGSCIPRSSEVELSEEAISEVESLIKLENFLERIKSLGKTITWDTLGNSKQIKTALNLDEKTKSRETAKALQTELVKISRYRNRIAHTGGEAADISRQTAKDHGSLFKAIAHEITTTIISK